MDELPPPPGALSAPSAHRNREPILGVLRTVLPDTGLLLEIASGSGEHALFFAAAMPGLRFLPTDPDAAALRSIAAWRARAGLPNLLAPERLDVAEPAPWPVPHADAVLCINMVHISPWEATLGLLAGAGRILPAGGVLFLYGPYLEDGVPTAESNIAFDASLRQRNPRWGLRQLAALDAAAAARGLVREQRVAMPANNLSLVFRRT
jgi:SAM-dependent methyltransferase